MECVVMSLVDWILRPVFSRDLRTVREGNHVWDIVEIVERYSQKAYQAPTNRALLDRNAIAGAALERVQNGGDFAYAGRDRLLELIAETPLYHRKALDVLAKDVREREYLDSALLLGSLVEEDDFSKGVFEGVQSNLLLRCAQLIFTFRHEDDKSVEGVLNALAGELDRKHAVDEDLSKAIRISIVSSIRLKRLDPTAAFGTLCALKTPSAAEDAARMFFRHPDLLSDSLYAQITQRLERGDEFGKFLLREVSNPNTLMREIQKGGENLLRRTFQELVDQKGSGFPAGNLRNQFERCAEAVKEAGQEIPLSAPAGP